MHCQCNVHKIVCAQCCTQCKIGEGSQLQQNVSRLSCRVHTLTSWNGIAAAKLCAQEEASVGLACIFAYLKGCKRLVKPNLKEGL